MGDSRFVEGGGDRPFSNGDVSAGPEGNEGQATWLPAGRL